MTALKRIGLIGGGNMGSCLVGGLIRHGHPSQQILVVDHNEKHRAQLEEKWQIFTTSNPKEILSQIHILVLAVKPQSMRAVVEEIAPLIDPQQTLIVSIAAVITTTQIQRWLSRSEFPVVRAMPNTPALLGVGITGVYASPQVNSAWQQQATILLQALGEVVWVKEEGLMDIVTALSGSGPAYFFYFMESLINSATALGLPEEIASKLTFNTALGSATMALHCNEDIMTLREKVTSKGGTTEQGINVLKDGKLQDLLAKTLTAATSRGKTLSEQYD